MIFPCAESSLFPRIVLWSTVSSTSLSSASSDSILRDIPSLTGNGLVFNPPPVAAMSCSRATSGFRSYFPGSDYLADPRVDLGDLLFLSLDRTLVGDLVIALIITLLDEGFDDEDRSDRSFLSCLPLSVPEETAGAAMGRRSLSRTSSIGPRVATCKSSFPPLPLFFLPDVAVDSDED